MDLAFHFSIGWGTILIVMVAAVVLILLRSLYS